MNDRCLVLFSGGTDSLCSAAIACENFKSIDLVTFSELGNRHSGFPKDNANKLIQTYPDVRITINSINIDKCLSILNYENYFANLAKFKLLNLATPGLSSLSWHIHAINYCLQNNIKHVYDGMTKELMHLPGHMPEVREEFTKLYKKYDITFSSPVIEWDVPEDMRFVDKLIVDRHGFKSFSDYKVRTTGLWLYEKNILPHPNLKGSLFDREMQKDCYQFVVYNMLAFWIYEPIFGFESFKSKIVKYIKSKIEFVTSTNLVTTVQQ